MNERTGFIKMYRKDVFGMIHNHNLLVFWNYCLAKAVYEEEVVTHTTKRVSRKVTLQPGDFIFTRPLASSETGLSERVVRHCLEVLQREGRCCVRREANDLAIVSVINSDVCEPTSPTRVRCHGQRQADVAANDPNRTFSIIRINKEELTTDMPISPSAQPAGVCMAEHLLNLRSELSVPPSVRMREKIDGWRDDLGMPTAPPVSDASASPPSDTLPAQMGSGAGDSPPESGKDQPPATGGEAVNDMPPERTTKPRKTPKAKTTFIPPSCDEVVLFFVENGYATEVGKQAFLYYHEANWIDSRGNPVKSWKQKMRGVWFKPSNLPQVQSSFPGGVRGIPTIHQAQMMVRERMARASLASEGKKAPEWGWPEAPSDMDMGRYMDMDRDMGRDGDVEIYQIEEMYHENNN